MHLSCHIVMQDVQGELQTYVLRLGVYGTRIIVRKSTIGPTLALVGSKNPSVCHITCTIISRPWASVSNLISLSLSKPAQLILTAMMESAAL